MRIVSWNCCDGFERKFGHLERLKPDIAIISECRPSCLKFAGLENRSIWVGDDGQKGMAVITYGPWSIIGPGPDPGERWFAPIRLSNGNTEVQVIGVWVDSKSDCVPPTLRAIERLDGFIAERPTILAGDFNQSVVWDSGRGPSRKFATVLDKLLRAGHVSAWHRASNEPHGKESRGTLYWRWKADAPYHIDFVFYPPELMELRKVDIGAFENYVATEISDHVPIIADFEFKD